MYIKDVIINLFNLEVEKIEDFEVTSAYGKAFVTLSLKRVPCECPQCHSLTSRINDYHDRTIKHAILNNIDTELIYHQRRMYCPNCRKAFSEKNPFVSVGRRVSNYTILQIMEQLREPRTTFSMVAKATNLSIPTVQKIFDEHAGISIRPFPEILCIDEVYISKYTQKVYSCVLADFESCQLYDLLPSRRKHDLYSYFSKIPEETRSNVKYVSMDMWEPYRDAASVFFKSAKICVDSFHVVSLVNRAFDKVRISVMKGFPKSSDEYYLLKKYTWILVKKNSSLKMDKDIYLTKDTSFRCKGYIKIRDLLNIMLDIDDELEAAYFLKEGYSVLNSTSTSENISERLDNWLGYLNRTNLDEFTSVKKSILNWKLEIINSFDTFEGRRISNGPIESINSRLKQIKNTANGYTVFERFRLRAMYSLNKDSTIKF